MKQLKSAPAEIETCDDCDCEVIERRQSYHVKNLCQDCERNRVDSQPQLLRAAKLVVERWEVGDLAEAVRELARVVLEA